MIQHITHTYLFRVIAVMVIVAFVSLIPAQSGYAQVVMQMPAPGEMVHTTPAFNPAVMAGMRVDFKDPFNFYFVMDKGQSPMAENVKKAEYEKLIKYFLASLTISNDDMWVNLSPHESNRIIPDNFAQTSMGRDLLAQDYILKQFTASLMYPEDAVGRAFWNKIYAQAYQKYGTTDIPVDTFNKVWITADQADIYQKNDTAFLVKSHLKVMLEQDLMALEKNTEQFGNIQVSGTPEANDARKIASDIVREVIIPVIEKEVNEGENFAQVRQIYASMIMASWFKRTLKESLLGQVYADQNKVAGIEVDDPQAKEKIYQQYVEAYKTGVFNYIKEEVDPVTNEMLPRKYFSGGFQAVDSAMIRSVSADRAVPVVRGMVQEEKLDSAQVNFASIKDGLKRVITNVAKPIIPLLAVALFSWNAVAAQDFGISEENAYGDDPVSMAYAEARANNTTMPLLVTQRTAVNVADSLVQADTLNVANVIAQPDTSLAVSDTLSTASDSLITVSDSLFAASADSLAERPLNQQPRGVDLLRDGGKQFGEGTLKIIAGVPTTVLDLVSGATSATYNYIRDAFSRKTSIEDEIQASLERDKGLMDEIIAETDRLVRESLEEQSRKMKGTIAAKRAELARIDIDWTNAFIAEADAPDSTLTRDHPEVVQQVKKLNTARKAEVQAQAANAAVQEELQEAVQADTVRADTTKAEPIKEPSRDIGDTAKKVGIGAAILAGIAIIAALFKKKKAAPAQEKKEKPAAEGSPADANAGKIEELRQQADQTRQDLEQAREEGNAVEKELAAAGFVKSEEDLARAKDVLNKNRERLGNTNKDRARSNELRRAYEALGDDPVAGWNNVVEALGPEVMALVDGKAKAQTEFNEKFDNQKRHPKPGQQARIAELEREISAYNEAIQALPEEVRGKAREAVHILTALYSPSAAAPEALQADAVVDVPQALEEAVGAATGDVKNELSTWAAEDLGIVEELIEGEFPGALNVIDRVVRGEADARAEYENIPFYPDARILADSVLAVRVAAGEQAGAKVEAAPVAQQEPVQRVEKPVLTKPVARGIRLFLSTGERDVKAVAGALEGKQKVDSKVMASLRSFERLTPAEKIEALEEYIKGGQASADGQMGKARAWLAEMKAADPQAAAEAEKQQPQAPVKFSPTTEESMLIGLMLHAGAYLSNPDAPDAPDVAAKLIANAPDGLKNDLRQVIDSFAGWSKEKRVAVANSLKERISGSEIPEDQRQGVMSDLDSLLNAWEEPVAVQGAEQKVTPQAVDRVKAAAAKNFFDTDRDENLVWYANLPYVAQREVVIEALKSYQGKELSDGDRMAVKSLEERFINFGQNYFINYSRIRSFVSEITGKSRGFTEQDLQKVREEAERKSGGLWLDMGDKENLASWLVFRSFDPDILIQSVYQVSEKDRNTAEFAIIDGNQAYVNTFDNEFSREKKIAAVKAALAEYALEEGQFSSDSKEEKDRMTRVEKLEGWLSRIDQAQKTDPLGGIDLSDDYLRINIKVDGQGMPLPVQFQDPAMSDIQGLSPIIREIAPVSPLNIPVISELLQMGAVPSA